MNVLVEILGKQFKAEKGDKLKVPYINKKIGEKLTFDSILYSDDGKNKKLGKPYLTDLQMEAKLLKHGKEKKYCRQFPQISRKHLSSRYSHQSLLNFMKFRRNPRKFGQRIANFV